MDNEGFNTAILADHAANEILSSNDLQNAHDAVEMFGFTCHVLEVEYSCRYANALNDDFETVLFEVRGFEDDVFEEYRDSIPEGDLRDALLDGEGITFDLSTPGRSVTANARLFPFEG